MSSLLLALLSFACSPKQNDGGQTEQNTALETSVRERTTAENLSGQREIATHTQQVCADKYIEASNEAWKKICFSDDSRNITNLTPIAAYVLNDGVTDKDVLSICKPAWECFDPRI